MVFDPDELDHMKRKVESGKLTDSVSPGVTAVAELAGVTFGELSPLISRFTFGASLNYGEMVTLDLEDPLFGSVNNLLGRPYLQRSREETFAPIRLRTKLTWTGSEELITTETLEHAVVSTRPLIAGPNRCVIQIVAVDQPSYFLSGGDAAGSCYTGNIKSVIETVVDKHGHGWLTCEFRGETKDDPHNKWWQCRMSPKAFIKSLLEWSSSLNEQKTAWLIYPDDDKLIVQEQALLPPKHRATYHYRGTNEIGQRGDVIEWEVIGDNALQMLSHRIVTAGISSVSGRYFDYAVENDFDAVAVGDDNTSNKLKPKTTNLNAFTKPSVMADPRNDDTVGWTMVKPIPEFSGGELGLRYEEYIDGMARGKYLGMLPALMRARMRVVGHNIWCGSEGLGVDTIRVVIMDPDLNNYFLHGNWIVYGFNHIYTSVPAKWVTDLYCYRIDYNARATEVGFDG